MKTRAWRLLGELLNFRLKVSDLKAFPILEAHLTAAAEEARGEGYREGYADGQMDMAAYQNPPGVAQPWALGEVKFEVNFEVPLLEPDPRLKSLTWGEVAQLGRALACTRARGER